MEKRISSASNLRRSGEYNVVERALRISSDPTVCYDISNWHDNHGESYDCDFYAAMGGDYCDEAGDLHGNLGLTANKACCACSGMGVIDWKEEMQRIVVVVRKLWKHS